LKETSGGESQPLSISLLAVEMRILMVVFAGGCLAGSHRVCEFRAAVGLRSETPGLVVSLLSCHPPWSYKKTMIASSPLLNSHSMVTHVFVEPT